MRFDSLDSLRGLAALAVALFHFSSGWAGYLAVDFFLVLSGFVLSHGYLYKDRNINFTEFLSHRLARLYPLHIFTLVSFILAFLLVNGVFPGSQDGTLFTLLQNLTLTQNIGFNPSGLTYNYPSWSISVELWINIIFFLFITKNTKTWILILGSIVGLLSIYFGTGHLDTHYKNYVEVFNSGVIRGMSSFLLGIVSYRLYILLKEARRIRKNINLTEWVCVGLVIFVVFARDSKTSEIDFFAPIIFMFAVSIFAFEEGYLSKYLRRFSYLGEISYSVYLNQVTLLIIARYFQKELDLPSLVVLGGYIASLLIYSHFTYQYVEKPLREKGRNALLKLSNRELFTVKN
ncbi:MAG: acyltransferase family protein [Neptuniibacter sp.]